MARRKARRQYGDVASHLAEQLKKPRFRREWMQAEADMALATRLIRLRTEQGLTQAQVAAMVSTSQSCLSRLERNPPRKVTPLLKRLATFYGQTVEVEVRLVPTR
jgi:DNA-binding XRE family transcriptional regulator